MTLTTIPLQSGSRGNCTLVESGDVRFLIDAGINGKQTALRLAEHGIDIRTIRGVLLSHDHSDHVKFAPVLKRKFGLPIYTTVRTWECMGCYGNHDMTNVSFFRSGERIRLGHVVVETIPTPHDGVDGVAFVIDDGKRRLGVLTDLGYEFDELKRTVQSLDAAIIESNHDVDLLENGPYPLALKKRIRGSSGHLSNADSAHLLREFGKNLQWACLAHLSGENNTPELALRTHRAAGLQSLRLVVAPRDCSCEPLVVV